MSKAETIKTSAQIEEEILSEGPRLRDFLLKKNPVLSPSHLDEYFEAYSDFYPDRSGFIWSRNEDLNVSRAPKLLLLVSGVAAGGKHELIKSLKRFFPNQMRNLCTVTTRPRRANEIDGVDHYFYSLEKFQKEQTDGLFIETVPEGDRWYGTPQKSIETALTWAQPIIYSDVEIGSGWPNVEKYLKDKRIPIAKLKIFVLASEKADYYFNVWLPNQPNPRDDLDYRKDRSGWEIWRAPDRDKADLIVTNPIRKGLAIVDYEAKALVPIIRQRLLY